jgi:hypothetical protein
MLLSDEPKKCSFFFTIAASVINQRSKAKAYLHTYMKVEGGNIKIIMENLGLKVRTGFS